LCFYVSRVLNPARKVSEFISNFKQDYSTNIILVFHQLIAEQILANIFELSALNKNNENNK